MSGLRATLPDLLLLALLPLPLGCVGLTCDRESGEPLIYTQGRVNQSSSRYESNASDEPFLHFPPGRSYRLQHRLGAMPYHYTAYLAYSPCPLSAELSSPGTPPRCASQDENANTPGFAENAGNSVIFEAVTDEYIEIRNDTCADSYVRVIAESFEADESAADAGPATRDE